MLIRSKNAFFFLRCLQVKMDYISIEDALKNEIDDKSMKTPISILQELLSRRGITPNYELVQIEGAVHKPMFKYRVSFNDKEAFGCGPSKKQAKHNCAKALIALLTGQSLPNDDAEANGSANNENEDEKVAGNPIGQLQELCMSRKWPPPTYETEMEVGLPHARQFTIACFVLNHQEVGNGKSKKIAKRNAAHKMWQKLKDIPIDQSMVIQLTDEDGNDVKVPVTHYSDLKDAKIATLTNQHSYKVSQFHKQLKGTYGKSLAKLQNTCLGQDINYVQFLQEIASEHQFEVTYVDIEEKTVSGKWQCLVQLSTLPVAVCHGSGPNPQDAQANAARNALEYLKIMTKRHK